MAAARAGWAHETRSSEVANDERESVQPGIKGRGSLLIWLDAAMDWHGRASGKRGRSRIFSDEAIQFCLSIKCLFSLPLRQAMGMSQSLLHLAGLVWPVADCSTASRRQKTLRVAIEVMPTTTGLHLVVDSAGIKMLGEGKWKTRSIALVPRHEVRFYERNGDWDEWSGRNGVATTDEVWWKRKYAASSCLGNASRRATLIAGSLNYRSVPLC